MDRVSVRWFPKNLPRAPDTPPYVCHALPGADAVHMSSRAATLGVCPSIGVRVAGVAVYSYSYSYRMREEE